MDNWTTEFFDVTNVEVIKTVEGFLNFNESDMVLIGDETYHVSHSYGLIDAKVLTVYIEADNDI